MSDKLNGNNDNDLEEEENEEEEEVEVINHGNEEDGQEFSVAFDIQINEGSFILLVGKTFEKKLILRLVEKEDETKPFFQNEFSLEELKEINSYFDIFDNEDDAINNVIKHLNESEKELELIDDNNIKISIIIKEEKINTKIDFVLIKASYVMEGEEEIHKITNEDENNIKNNKNKEDEMANLEEVNDEGIEEVENENDNENENGEEFNDNYEKGEGEHIDEANLEYSEENLEKSEKKDKNNEKVSNAKKNINLEEISKNLDLINNSSNKNISKNIQNENGLHTIIEEANENAVLSVESNEPVIEQNKEKITLNENKTNENDEKIQKSPKKENNIENLENSGISKVIEELKNNLDSLGGAMNLMEEGEEDEQEQNTNENEFNKNKNDELILFKHEIMKTIEALSENFNSQLQKQNNFIIEMEKNIKEKNDKEIKELKNEINKKDNELNEFKNILNENNEKIINMEKNINKANEEIKKLNEELKNKTNKELNSSFKKQNKNSINGNDIERIENDLNLKLKEIEKKLKELKNDYDKNKKNNDNVNIKTFLERINNIDNRLKQNEENTSNNNNLINDNMNSIDNKIKSFETKIKNIEGIKKGDKDKKILLDKIFNLENKSKNFENKINDFEKNNPDKEIYEKIEILENLVNEIKENKNKKEKNTNDIIKKVNNLIKITRNYEDQFQTFEDDIKNNDKNIEKLQIRVIKLENKTKILSDTKQEKKTKKEILDREEDITNIFTNGDLRKLNTNINNSSAKKKQKRNSQRNSQRNSFNANNSEEEEQKAKNYRIIKHREEKNPDGKYISQTYDKLGVITSHSVNRFSIKKQNPLEKNDDYEIFTRPRSKSKDHKRNREKELENLSDNQLSKSIKYKDVNPPIPKEYENNITDSRIVEYDDFVFVENRIKEIYPKLNIELNLVYRASEDGDKSKDFHKKCDKIGPNVTLVKTKKGYVFGGFTAKNWEHLKRDININKPNLGSASRDMKAFGFCVNIQKIYNNEKPDEFAIWCNRNYGPTFKNNFFQIFNNCFTKGGYCSLRKNSHFGGQEYDYEISGGESKFGVDEVEVYEDLFN